MEVVIKGLCSGLYDSSFNSKQDGARVEVMNLEIRNPAPSGKFDRYLTLPIDKSLVERLDLRNKGSQWVNKEVKAVCSVSQWQGIKLTVVDLLL